MYKRIRFILPGLFAALVFSAGAAPPQAANQAPTPADEVRAAVNAKYSQLLRVINVPQDQADYGQFNDYGHYTGTEWAGYDNLPPGYWVYVAPNWYIWGKQGQPQPMPQPVLPNQAQNPDQVKASVNGKYANLLRVINVPQDQAVYGLFNDWGHYTGTSWAGHDNLPPGYWVYVAPNWYIWGNLGPLPAAANVPPQASVNGKYLNLLKVIDVPQDQATYGQFHDWGFWTGTSWAGHDNLPPGYWVYVAPKWYIWGQSK